MLIFPAFRTFFSDCTGSANFHCLLGSFLFSAAFKNTFLAYAFQYWLLVRIFQSPELEARLEKLKAQQANRDYKEMTKNVDLTVSMAY